MDQKQFMASYKALWLSMPVILILVLINPKGAFDLQLHDTYYVIGAIHLAVAFSIFLGLTGLTYWALRKYKLTKWVKQAHVILTIVSLISIMAITIIQGYTPINNTELFKSTFPIMNIVILIFMISQLLFISNVIAGIARDRKS